MMSLSRSLLLIGCALVPLQSLPAYSDTEARNQVPPYSNLASEAAERNWRETQVLSERVESALKSKAVSFDRQPLQGRRIVDEIMLQPGLERLRSAFPVSIEPATIGGVQTDVVTPTTGVSVSNRHRVLINLHGGGMIVGGRLGGQQESVPIASLMQIKVVTVDYRLAPEHRFPAASEDVARVYSELLRSYRPENVGIYGCSSGADLTAQSLAWFQANNLPRPGAVGLFGSGAAISDRWGDSYLTTRALEGKAITGLGSMTFPNPYLAGSDVNTPIVTPAYFPHILAKFPPSLLISGTRDMALSVTAYTHAQLIAAGVDAQLHVFEGAPHCSFAQGAVDPAVPETRQAWSVISRFFDRTLGKSAK